MAAAHPSRSIRRVLFAILLITLLGGPCALLLMAVLPIFKGTADISEQLLTPSLLSPDLILSLLAGVWMCALPTAVLIFVIVESFAQHGKYHWLIATLSGTAAGLIVLTFIIAFVFYGPSATSEIPIATGITGATMGLLYWVIVIEPRRRS